MAKQYIENGTTYEWDGTAFVPIENKVIVQKSSFDDRYENTEPLDTGSTVPMKAGSGTPYRPSDRGTLTRYYIPETIALFIIGYGLMVALDKYLHALAGG